MACRVWSIVSKWTTVQKTTAFALLGCWRHKTYSHRERLRRDRAPPSAPPGGRRSAALLPAAVLDRSRNRRWRLDDHQSRVTRGGVIRTVTEYPDEIHTHQQVAVTLLRCIGYLSRRGDGPQFETPDASVRASIPLNSPSLNTQATGKSRKSGNKPTSSTPPCAPSRPKSNRTTPVTSHPLSPSSRLSRIL